MRILAAEPPGAEKPPTLPPAASTLWQGIISATGFFAMAWPTSRAASGPAPSSFEIAPYSGDRLGHLRRGRSGFCPGHLAQQNSFGRCGALCWQLEARDAHAVPRDPAKAARGFENEIMVHRLARHMTLAFRSAMELVEPRREFNRVLAF